MCWCPESFGPRGPEGNAITALPPPPPTREFRQGQVRVVAGAALNGKSVCPMDCYCHSSQRPQLMLNSTLEPSTTSQYLFAHLLCSRLWVGGFSHISPFTAPGCTATVIPVLQRRKLSLRPGVLSRSPSTTTQTQVSDCKDLAHNSDLTLL